MVLRGAERFAEGFSFSSPLTNFTVSTFATEPLPPLKQDEEIGVAGLRGLAQVDGAEVLQFVFIVRDRGIDLGVSAGERGQAAARFGSGRRPFIESA